MKKIISLIAVCFLSAVCAFAFDLTTVHGTWHDSKYNANWTFSAEGKIVLTDGTTGQVYFTFDDSNVKNFRVSVEKESGENGVSISFSCPETRRTYKFFKAASLSTDIKAEFQPAWTNSAYRAVFPFVK